MRCGQLCTCTTWTMKESELDEPVQRKRCSRSRSSSRGCTNDLYLLNCGLVSPKRDNNARLREQKHFLRLHVPHRNRICYECDLQKITYMTSGRAPGAHQPLDCRAVYAALLDAALLFSPQNINRKHMISDLGCT
jgi:hypothetical protein